MQRTYIHIPEEVNTRIAIVAKMQKKSKAHVIREALEQGIKVIRPRGTSSTQALLKIMKEAKKFAGQGPKDLSINHDYYTWGGSKKTPATKV